MALLDTTIHVGGNYVLYEIEVKDSNQEVEFGDFVFRISGDASGLSEETVRAAVQAFGDSLASSVPTYSVNSLTKITVTQSAV